MSLSLLATDVSDDLVIDIFSCLTAGSNQSLRTWHSVAIEDLTGWALVVPIWSSEGVSLSYATRANELLGRLIKESLYFVSVFSLGWVHRRALVDLLIDPLYLAIAWS